MWTNFGQCSSSCEVISSSISHASIPGKFLQLLGFLSCCCCSTQEVSPDDVPPDQCRCSGCGQSFSGAKDKHVFRCPQCHKVGIEFVIEIFSCNTSHIQVFCSECDIFLHETLHSCPGCAAKPGQKTLT